MITTVDLASSNLVANTLTNVLCYTCVMSPNTLFQYCPKLIVLSDDRTKVLLAKRKGEADYNDTYTFIGGKMETTDKSILAGIKREKNEEIGVSAKLRILPNEAYTLLFQKKDGHSMVIPHIASIYMSGDIQLSDEYSDYRWVSIIELATFEPKIENIPQLTQWAIQKLSAPNQDFVEIQLR